MQAPPPPDELPLTAAECWWIGLVCACILAMDVGFGMLVWMLFWKVITR